MSTSRLTIALSVLAVLLSVGIAVGPVPRVFAQTFIQPPAAPTGGNSALWLTTGTADERKLGSLMIGTSITPSKICLNAADSETTNLASTKCVASWTEALSLAGGPFVPLRATTVLSAANQSDPNIYFTTPFATDPGAVTIQATGNSASQNQAISLIVEANDDPGMNFGYGLFAGDGGVAANYAAQFSGRVGIGSTIDAAGNPVLKSGLLCLNDTATYASGGATGCISAWGDLVGGNIAGFVKLQTTNSPGPETGTAAVGPDVGTGFGGVGNFGTVIFGHPPAGQPAKTFCGDGLCSTHINENSSADVNYCAIDCEAPLPPLILNVFASTTPNSTSISIHITPTSGQLPSGPSSVRLLLVRSTNPSFISDLKSAFVPQNGVVYSNGQVINGVTVSYAVTLNQSGGGIDIFENVPTTRTTYYYRLYQANLFPIYNTAPLTNSGTPG